MKNNKAQARKILTQLFAVLIASLSLVSLSAQAHIIPTDDKVTMNYSFSTPTLTTIDIVGTTYTRVTMPECSPGSNAGEPKVPSKGVFILLPPKTTVGTVEVTQSEQIILGYGYLVEPTSQAIPTSQTENIPVPTPNPAIYQANQAYPGCLYTTVGVQTFRGYQILVLLLHPVQYNPVTGELSYYQTFTVTVQTQGTDTVSRTYRGSQEDQAEVAQKVDNPDMVSRYQQECTPLFASREHDDLLILTTDALESGFEPLKEVHDAQGTATVIKTLSDVGSSDLNAIRDYIRDAYTNWSISYVLIGGDDGVFPTPMLWVSGMDENTTYYEDTLPSDLFYACLDGPYNYDGDNKWGEPHDGEGGGDVDLTAEVYVGRACVDSMTDVNNFVTKTIATITLDPQTPFLTHYLLSAEYLGDYGIASYGSTYMNQLIDNCSDDGYTTVGIPTSEYTLSTLYDTPSYYWDPSEMEAYINSGIHVINHLGHASFDYNMKMMDSDVLALNNPSNRTCFIYSQGCDSGGFDDSSCIAKYFTVKSTHAAFAGIWNARYGFFWSYSTDGDSQRFMRHFWDEVFGENILQLGRANHASKEANLPILNRSCIRWVYYETNLFGDPTVKIVATGGNNAPPLKPTTPQGPSSGKAGANYTFTTSTVDPNGDDVYYQWSWGDSVSGWLGPYPSGKTISSSHTWEAAGDYSITVNAKDSQDAESNWSNPAVIHVTAEAVIEIGVIKGGFGVSAVVRNVGVVDATDVNWSISLQGLVFFHKQTQGSLLTIAHNGERTISTGLVLGLGKISILVKAADTEKNATAYLLGPLAFNIQ